MRWKKESQSEARTWIMFLTAIGILLFMAKNNKLQELGGYATILLGAMLGLAVMASAMTNILGSLKKGPEDDSHPKGSGGTGSNGQASSSDSKKVVPRHQEDTDPLRMGIASPWHIPSLGIANASSA